MKTACSLAPLLLTGMASAQFGPQETLVLFFGVSDANQIDFDLDGDLDLVVATVLPGTVYTIENLSDGTLGLPQPVGIVGEMSGCNHARVGDVDGDGHPDILATASNADKIVWYPFLGPGSFGPEQSISSTVDFPSDIIAADVDGDGDLDVISAGQVANAIYFHENLGGGMFAAEVVISTAVLGPTGLAIGDLDSDGLDDLISSSVNDDKIAWYAGAGDGTFGVQRLITTGADGATDVLAADLDNDGRLDVVYCSSVDGRIRWSRNTGGLFASPQTLDLACAGATRIAADDIDQDGDIDLAAACATGGVVRVYENVGFGFFAAPVSLPGTKTAVQLCKFLDVDGDLDRDVVASSGFNSSGLVLNRNIRTVGATYCTSPANSSGDPGVLTITGSGIVDRNRIALTASDLSASSFGYFLTSRTQGMVNQPAGSQGVLCLGGSIGRYVGQGQIQFSGVFRSIRLILDTTQVPQPLGFVSFQAGETWRFQAWHRDTVGGQATSNFSDAVSVSFQ